MNITEELIYDLNNMNVYAQRAKLGDLLLKALEENGEGGSGSGDALIITKDSYLEFPNIGNPKYLYIDSGANIIYRWDRLESKYYSVGIGIDSILGEIQNTIEFVSGGDANS